MLRQTRRLNCCKILVLYRQGAGAEQLGYAEVVSDGELAVRCFHERFA